MGTYYAKSTLDTANSAGWAGQNLRKHGTIILGNDLGTAPLTTGPLDGDVYRLVKLPKGAVVTGGRLVASRFASGTSAASTTCKLNIGFSGAFKELVNSTSYGATTASTALGSAVPCDFAEASVGSVKGESGLNYDLGGLLYTLGPLKLSEEQFAQVKFSGSASSFVSGAALTLIVDYYIAEHA